MKVLASSFADLSGQTFGRGVALARIGRTGAGYAIWKMRCSCGNEYHAVSRDLLRGDTKSCGCLKVDICRARSTTHGASAGGQLTREYRIWSGMRNRCQNPNNKSFGDYGGRGIRIHTSWSSFPQFLLDMGKCPSDTHSLGRVNNSGHYEPSNCRWETPAQQGRNTTKTRRISFGGVEKSLTDWAMSRGITPAALTARLKRGWNLERALQP